MRPFCSLTLVLLLPAAGAQAAPPKPNFADLPAYLQALNRSTDPEASAIRERIASGPADLVREQAAAEKQGIPVRPTQTPLPLADQNAAPLYNQLDALRKEKPLHLPRYAQPLNGRYAYTPEQISAVQKEVDTRQDIFTLLHQAADKPQCVFADVPTGPLGTSSAFTHYAGLRESAREINTESLLLAYDDHFSDALANQERGFKVAGQAASGGTAISYLVGAAVEAITLNGMQTNLALAGPNASLDSHAEADILALPPLSLRRALAGDALYTRDNFARLRQANPAELAQAFPQGSPFVGSPSASASLTPAERLQVVNLLDAAQADYLHQLCRLAAAADLPGAKRDLVFDQVEARALANQSDPIEALADLLNPVTAFDADTPAASATGQFIQQADRLTARRLAAAAGAAVLAEKAQTGAFPSRLPPAFLDPFTDKPLGYRLEGTNGFVVYSAGSAQDFDGGKPGEKTPFGSIVFRYPLVPVPIPADMLK